MEIPTNIPEKGFYYHYKHNSENGLNNYAYEVVGVGRHTEGDLCRPEDLNMVVYRPLYSAKAYGLERFFYLRPLEMFLENVTKDGKTFPRFTKITDVKIIAKLEDIKGTMYGEKSN